MRCLVWRVLHGDRPLCPAPLWGLAWCRHGGAILVDMGCHSARVATALMQPAAGIGCRQSLTVVERGCAVLIGNEGFVGGERLTVLVQAFCLPKARVAKAGI
eukprot:scaffold4990_cov387-Prasinococcus_capsulatus_cf.AAC.33